MKVNGLQAGPKMILSARGGGIVLIGEKRRRRRGGGRDRAFVPKPDMSANFAPIVYAAPILTLAYHTAVIMVKTPTSGATCARRWLGSPIAPPFPLRAEIRRLRA